MNFEDYQIIDISPIISNKTAVFPGDIPFQRKVSLDFQNGNNLLLSSILTTLHIGAHVDAPSHYHQQGQSVSDRELSYYIGDCQVISVQKQKNEVIRPEDILHVNISAKRILFRTLSANDPFHFNNDFVALSPNLIDFLALKNVVLVGIDTPSVDFAHSKKIEAHQSLYKHNMANIEGLQLNHVQDGKYILIALPLKIENADASPVRAVLLHEPEK